MAGKSKPIRRVETVVEKTEKGTKHRQDTFLRMYDEFGTIKESAEAAGVTRRTHELWRQHDVLGYTQRFNDAKDDFTEIYESAIRDTVKKQMSEKGELNSTGALIVFNQLNKRNPEEYRERVVKDEDGVAAMQYFREAAREYMKQQQLQQVDSVTIEQENSDQASEKLLEERMNKDA